MNNGWIKYYNGNYTVFFNPENGTKIRHCIEDVLEPEFPENIDLFISNKCDCECPWCYAGCSSSGHFGNLNQPAFINGLQPYTELALNLNFPVHPDLEGFLEKVKDRAVFVNITVSQKHFFQHYRYIENLYEKGLFYGLGISFSGDMDALCYAVSHTKIENIVIHVINGLFCSEDFKTADTSGIKLLILGYKTCGRGEAYYEKSEYIKMNQEWLEKNITEILASFKAVAFDNTALEQLSIRNILTEQEWDTFYMGDDGTATLAVDFVTNQFSKNSTFKHRQVFSIEHLSPAEMLRTLHEKKIVGEFTNINTIS